MAQAVDIPQPHEHRAGEEWNCVSAPQHQFQIFEEASVGGTHD